MSTSKSKQTLGKPTANAKPARRPVNLWLIVALVVVMSIIVACAPSPSSNTSESSISASLPKEISVEQAKELYDSGAFVLDVRQPEEWDQVHIPGTTLIPLGELQNRLSEVPKDKEVVVVCRSGNRSQQGRDILLNGGFDQVTSMAGGVNQWSAAGYPTVSGP
jgi:rhodanese-related sulfurtransferase